MGKIQRPLVVIDEGIPPMPPKSKKPNFIAKIFASFAGFIKKAQLESYLIELNSF